MNTRKKLVSIALLMASITTTVIISTTDLLSPAENRYVHAWTIGGNIDDKGQIENEMQV